MKATPGAKRFGKILLSFAPAIVFELDPGRLSNVGKAHCGIRQTGGHDGRGEREKQVRFSHRVPPLELTDFGAIWRADGREGVFSSATDSWSWIV
jgi:hypothetical protein